MRYDEGIVDRQYAQHVVSGVVNPQPESSTQEVLAGLVERVTFHNADNGFCVLRTKACGHRDLVTVVGHAAMVSAREWITASGEWSAVSTRRWSWSRKSSRNRKLGITLPTGIENMKPTSITIFLLEGDPNGIRTAQFSMSTIQAIAFRRHQLAKVRKAYPEIMRPGGSLTSANPNQWATGSVIITRTIRSAMRRASGQIPSSCSVKTRTSPNRTPVMLKLA